MKISLTALFLGSSFFIRAAELAPVVVIEEDVYIYTNASNGAGPMWCGGSTCLVRSGDHVFASGLETVADAKPLNNCRWVLFHRAAKGWERVRVDEGRTREPVPLVAFQDGRIFLSANPTLGSGPQPNGGPARPDVLQFAASDPTAAPLSLTPVWQGEPKFTEHSYRSFAADGRAGELVLFQNIGYTHAEWSLRGFADGWFDDIFGVRVKGTSLEPVARDGQIVLIKKQDIKRTLKDDMLACISIEGIGDVIKRCHIKDARLILSAINPNEREIPILIEPELIQQAYELKGVLFEVGIGKSMY